MEIKTQETIINYNFSIHINTKLIITYSRQNTIKYIMKEEVFFLSLFRCPKCQNVKFKNFSD